MKMTPTDKCDQAALAILTEEWKNLPSSDPVRRHIASCSECQSRIQEVRFFAEAFSSDDPKVSLRRKEVRGFSAPPLPLQQDRTATPWVKPLIKVITFAAAACLVAMVAWNLLQPAGIGRVAALEGEATIRRFGKRTYDRLEESDQVQAGDLIRTEAGSKLCLRLEESNDVHLNESTEVRIEATRLLHHNTGEAWFEIAKGNGEFEVETRGADVLVLGTSFGIQYAEDEVRVPVSSGRVRLQTKGGEIELTPGQIGSYPSGQAFLPPKRGTELYPDSRPAWLLPLPEEDEK